MATTSNCDIRILVVDDEENISYLVSAALKNCDFTVETCSTGKDALSCMRTFHPHLIILDVLLPDLEGFEVLRRIRELGANAPVIFLSALDSTDDKVRGLTSGGDDYVVKPFALEELVARVEVQLKRMNLHQKSSRIEIDSLILDTESRRVWRSSVESQLSATEFNLLHLLASNVGKVMTRSQILNHVWEYSFDGDSTIIESVISNVRKKVDYVEPRLIHTVRGVGYSIRVPE